MEGKSVPLFDMNPFQNYQGNTSPPQEKFKNKDLPLSVSNDEIQKFLLENSIAIITNLKYSLIRDENNELTTTKNGDRFAYVLGQMQPIMKRYESIASTR